MSARARLASKIDVVPASVEGGVSGVESAPEVVTCSFAALIFPALALFVCIKSHGDTSHRDTLGTKRSTYHSSTVLFRCLQPGFELSKFR